MVQMVCRCLNVRVHGKGNTLELRDIHALNLSEVALADEFFSSKVYDVSLDLGGVTKAQKGLCTSRCVDGWVITTCVGCELDIYAKHLDDNDRVLVSSTIEKDSSRITTLIESENYSSLFKLLLPELNDNFVQNNFGSEFRSSNDSFGLAVKNVQHQVSSFLRDEQRAMEERIRMFTEQQQAKYNQLQQKVRRHKQAMVYLLLKTKDRKALGGAESLVESISPSSPLSPVHHSSDESSLSSDSANIQNKSNDESSMETNIEGKALKGRLATTKRSFRRMISVNNPPTRPKRSWPMRPISHSIDCGGVFDMDDFEAVDDSVPFYNSDDDTDGSSTEDNVSQKPDKNKEQCAGSLPISVPALSSYSRYSIYEEEEQSHMDPEQLAASFLAIGHSVHDGTEMFGDLPRRRLNTGELLQFRPT